MPQLFLFEFNQNDVPNTVSDDDWLDILQGVISDRRFMFEIKLTRHDGLDYDETQNLWWSRAYKEAKKGPNVGVSIADRNRAKATQMTRLFRDGEVWDGATLQELLDDDEVDESDMKIMTAIADGDVYVSSFRVFTYLDAVGGKAPSTRPNRAKTSTTFRKGRQGGYCPFINDSAIELKDIQIYYSKCLRFSRFFSHRRLK